jgi:DNA repair protein RadA/Sms
MAKSTSLYICQNCEATYSKWQGQCDSCGEWNTLLESLAPATNSTKSGRTAPSAKQLAQTMVRFSEVKPLKGSEQRFSTGIAEFDRVLGGGIVAGAVMLIGGEPGIGKSTLLTQVVLSIQTKVTDQHPVLYVSGEESPHQISLRINRIKSFEGNNLVFNTSTDVDLVVAAIEKTKPSLVIVDSIQTMSTEDLTGAAGSAGQVRESADRLTTAAKRLNIPIFLVGHVTKEGSIAGPKVLEHIVDSVLELSGERTGDLRILRAIKNRFGATDEVGLFRVAEFGLEEVTNPSQFFLEHADTGVPGSATICVMEGTRPILAEVQALVVSSQLAMPRRVGRGIELSRIQVLAAILQKHCRLPLGATDIFLSAAGGFTIKEPAVDLGLAVAIASSLKNKPVPAKTIFIGEMGLLGEIRSVNYLDRRVKEAKRLGFSRAISRKTHTRVNDVLKELSLV